jgi:tagatose-6-phosphate ketose/aldose isomerase
MIFREVVNLDAFGELLSLSEQDKSARGLLHTPKEIAQQPDTWKETFRHFKKHRAQIQEFLRFADSSQHLIVFLIGAGTSDYIGRSLASLLCRLWQCVVIPVPSTDLATHFEESILPGQSYLWISFSRSGASPETAVVLEKALETHPDIHHIVVSCNAKGRMILGSVGKKQVLNICLDETVNDQGLAMTSSFTNMVVFGQCLAHVQSTDNYEEILGQLVNAGKSFMGVAAGLAGKLAAGHYSKACFVGSGPLQAVAKEAALKLLELTAGEVFTMSESALGLRHGPMAALDKDTLLVCFVSGDSRIQKFEIDLLEEIGRKKLVQTRVAVARESSSALDKVAENVITPGTNSQVADDYRAPVDVIFAQMLGLFFSLNRGLKPDCPSPNGAISRVVEAVSIY